MKKLILSFLICINVFSTLAQDTININGINLLFIEKLPKNLFQVTQYAPLKNDSLKAEFITRFKAYLERYPKYFFDNSVKEIFICDSFSFENSLTAGVYIAHINSAIFALYPDYEYWGDYWFQIERTMHHELSHATHDKYYKYFNKKTWKKNNATEYIKRSSGLDIDSTRLSEGFPNNYAKNNIREDFAIFSECVLTPNPQYYELIDKYPRAYQKHLLTIEFYKKTNPLFFNDEYFENLKKQCVLTK